jgi:hypothetical protein
MFDTIIRISAMVLLVLRFDLQYLYVVQLDYLCPSMPLDRYPHPFVFISEGDESNLTNAKQQELDFVNIGYPNGLNGLQRRLIHQLVRNEFPSCRVFARSGGEFMQVEKLDPVKEAMVSHMQSLPYGADQI